MSKETYILHKKTAYNRCWPCRRGTCGCRQIMSQKRPIYLSKETYIYAQDNHIQWPPVLRARHLQQHSSRHMTHSLHLRLQTDNESKETYILVKRDLYTCQTVILEREWVLRRLLRERESHSERERESLVKERVRKWISWVKRDLYICQKRPVYLSKETCIHVKMSLSLSRESWFCAGSCASENYSERERESHSQRESGSCDSLESKETYIHVKRDLYTCQKRPVYMSKYRERERVGLAQALARERVSQRESERVTLRERDSQES